MPREVTFSAVGDKVEPSCEKPGQAGGGGGTFSFTTPLSALSRTSSACPCCLLPGGNDKSPPGEATSMPPQRPELFQNSQKKRPQVGTVRGRGPHPIQGTRPLQLLPARQPWPHRSTRDVDSAGRSSSWLRSFALAHSLGAAGTAPGRLRGSGPPVPPVPLGPPTAHLAVSVGSSEVLIGRRTLRSLPLSCWGGRCGTGQRLLRRTLKPAAPGENTEI